MDGYFIIKNENSIQMKKKTWKRLWTGFLTFAPIVTGLSVISVYASETQYWTESKE